MARINGIFPKQEQSEINYLKYCPETKAQEKKNQLYSALTDLGLNGTIEPYQNCISGAKYWRTNDGDHYPTFYSNGKNWF